MFKPHKVPHKNFRSFMIACLQYNIQPIMHLRDGVGYLYYIDEVFSKRDRVVSPTASKAVLDEVWNEIGVIRLRLRECSERVKLQDPTIKDF